MKVLHLLLLLAVPFIHYNLGYCQSDSAKIANLFSQGDKYNSKMALDSAKICFLEAEKNCIEEKRWAQYVRCENELGIIMQKTRNNKKAYAYYRNAFAKGKAIWGPDSSQMAYCYFNVSFELRETGKLDSAFLYLQMARKIWTKQFGETNDYVIMTCNKLAFLLIDMSKFKEALSWLLKVKDLRILKYGANSPNVAGSYGNLGSLYHIVGDYDKSIENLEKSLALYQKTSPLDNKNIAACYNNMGLVYNDLGDLNKAMECQKKALQIRLASLPALHQDIAASYNNIASLHYDKGEFREGLNCEKKALAIKRAIMDENNPLIAKSINNIGLFYYEESEFSEALQWQQQALEMRRKVLPEDNPDIAESYTNIGNIYRKQKDFRQALIFLNKALYINRKIFGDKHETTADAYLNIGSVQEDMHQYDSALVYHRKALNILTSNFGSKHPSVADCYFNIANVFLCKKNLDSALHYNDSALQSVVKNWKTSAPVVKIPFDSVVYKPQYFRIMGLRAEILLASSIAHENKANRIEALAIHKYLVDLADWIRSNLFEQDSKLIFTQELPDIFSKAIDNCFALFHSSKDSDYLNDAYAFSEYLKAGVLTESIVESEAEKYAGIPDSLILKEKKYKIDVNRKEAWIHELSTQPDRQNEADSLESALFQSKQNFKILKDSIQRSYPKYYELKSKPQVPLVSEISGALKPDEAVIEYTLSDSLLFIFTFTDKLCTLQKVAFADSMHEDIKHFLAAINKIKLAEVNRLAPRLYNVLVRPIADLFESKKNVHIVPDGQLWLVPFETLFPVSTELNTDDFSNHDFLIKHNAISYHVSGSLWFKNRKKTHEPQDKTLYDFIGFAPVFDDHYAKGEKAKDVIYTDTLGMEMAMRTAGENTWQLRPLPYSRNEVEDIQALFLKKHKSSEIFLYKGASKQNFESEAKKGRIIHIASHAIMNTSEPELSGIFFAQGDTLNQWNALKDGHVLFSGETYNLDIRTNLLVLSACETGTGKIRGGEGVISLSRGFIYDGVPNIMYSLWKIGDKNTYSLMTAFYKFILSGLSYSKALQQAKLELIKEPALAFPKNWAGFELVGN
jgi:CHAT domain-containing protein/Tfp pilus assembly protein PilF